MTEDEAKEKWCPFYRVAGAGNATDWEWHDNRNDANLGHAWCIASACLAWRWNYGESPREVKHEAAVNRPHRSPHGYCGIAGKPDQ